MFVSVSVGEFVCVAVRELVFVSMHGTVWVLLYMSVPVAVRVLVSEPLCMSVLNPVIHDFGTFLNHTNKTHSLFIDA